MMQWIRDRLNVDDRRVHVSKAISLLLYVAYIVTGIIYPDLMKIGGGWLSFALFAMCLALLVFPCHAPVLNGIGFCGMLALEAMRNLIPPLKFIPESFIGYLLMCMCITLAAWGTSFGRKHQAPKPDQEV
ncbi:hypothetical protein [Bifidobacterium leontopitheci]|uniref:Uncharacterized protein n=1 Tax=Bifidobacterium leontopitheci TaxID=2650774 RepID=A0A6I1GQ61_9BIFI|nr:hypothetical protein [Bifidobacterium leontopitheci]KAB7791427.1 hypothetical protein F7D09_0102 [Bifidobacterium leontopitheci]